MPAKPLKKIIPFALFWYKATHPCVDCGETDPLVLDFDHVYGEKAFNLSACKTLAVGRVIEEIAKCDVRCANCHRRRTAQQNNPRIMVWSRLLRS
jgi:hypothetical protein